MSADNSQFGQRYLLADADVFRHNAWDNVDWSEEKAKEALEIVDKQKSSPVDEAQAAVLLQKPSYKWEEFYAKHESKFFLDRNWIEREFFPHVLEAAQEGREIRLLEVGCGVGNTFFPLAETTKPHSNIRLYCSDFSATAIGLLKNNPLYDPERCTAFVWDITSAPMGCPVEEGSFDCIILVYVLSALKPSDHAVAMRNVARLLKPGGKLFFKDYGRYDLTQLRFKSNRLIDENFYCRGDGTLVYFFDSGELHELFTSCGLEKIQNNVDKRLIVNRKKKIVMHRRWVQCVYTTRPV